MLQASCTDPRHTRGKVEDRQEEWDESDGECEADFAQAGCLSCGRRMGSSRWAPFCRQCRQRSRQSVLDADYDDLGGSG
jgi:hypothetical protein